MLIFVRAFVTDERGRAGTYARAATPSRVRPPMRLWGVELGQALSPSLAAATKSGTTVYGVTKRGTAPGWLHRVIEMNLSADPPGMALPAATALLRS